MDFFSHHSNLFPAEIARGMTVAWYEQDFLEKHTFDESLLSVFL